MCYGTFPPVTAVRAIFQDKLTTCILVGELNCPALAIQLQITVPLIKRTFHKHRHTSSPSFRLNMFCLLSIFHCHILTVAKSHFLCFLLNRCQVVIRKLFAVSVWCISTLCAGAAKLAAGSPS